MFNLVGVGETFELMCVYFGGSGRDIRANVYLNWWERERH